MIIVSDAIWLTPRGFVATGANMVAGLEMPSDWDILASMPAKVSAMFTLVFATVVNYFVYNRAIKQGTILWGKIDFVSQFVLIFLAFISIWTMGLMGAVRSLVKKYYHTYSLMPDFTAESFTPTSVVFCLVDYRDYRRLFHRGKFSRDRGPSAFQFEDTRTRRQSCSCQGQVRLDAGTSAERTRICMGNVIKKLAIGLVVGGVLVGIYERPRVSLRLPDAVLRLRDAGGCRLHVAGRAAAQDNERGKSVSLSWHSMSCSCARSVSPARRFSHNLILKMKRGRSQRF